MILYRKTQQLRIRRAPIPEPPFWAATTIAPYGTRRAEPVAVDYLDLRATHVEKHEVTVCENVRDEIERARQPLHEPVLIDASEVAEVVFRRGEEALALCDGAMFLTSTRGGFPSNANATIVIAAWPLERVRLEALFARATGMQWGVAIPVIFPVTTELAALTDLADLAQRFGATFFAPISVAVDATAKQAIAKSRNVDEETYAMLFHDDLDPLHTATERHIAALASQRGMADFIIPPQWDARTNWNAAVLLTRTASRMLAMEHELELAATLARSARIVAELDKPIARVAEAASLAIIDALDDVSVEILEEWLRGDSPWFVDEIDAKWRVRRDYGV
ncbi:MAG TPA: hypothetical protein VMU84_20245 [Thermoanaerobaculia bacterium]|nr:hypothetical protein [Thermoanaerobaculia bacterium]